MIIMIRNFLSDLMSIALSSLVTLASTITSGSVCCLGFDNHCHMLDFWNFFNNNFLSLWRLSFYNFFRNYFLTFFLVDLSSQIANSALESKGFGIVDLNFLFLVVLLNFVQFFLSQLKHINESQFLVVKILQLLL